MAIIQMHYIHNTTHKLFCIYVSKKIRVSYFFSIYSTIHGQVTIHFNTIKMIYESNGYDIDI